MKKKSGEIKVSAIIAAGGKGTRMRLKTGKQLLKLAGKPILIRTLEKFDRAESIDEVIVVIEKTLISIVKKLIGTYKIRKAIKVVAGGKERTESVKNGLRVLALTSEIVAVHDGARPLITPDIINQSIEAAKKHGAVVVAVPAKDTIKTVNSNGEVAQTLNRALLWQAQTPQVFKRQVLQEAYRKANRQKFTDDAAVVEASGKKIKIITGDYRNIKITTPEDLTIAEALIKC